MRKISEEDIAALKRSDLFDAEWYLQQYPDVEVLGMDPAEHFLSFGAQMNRDPAPGFDVATYIDSEGTVGETLADILLRHVRKLDASVAAPSVQTVTMPVVESPPPDEEKASRLVVRLPRVPVKTNGLSEALLKQYELIRAEFDLVYYLLRYPDIANAVNLDPIRHYLENGAREGRNPSSEFDTKYYVACYPDVAATKMNPFCHYLEIGRAEGRRSNPFSAGDEAFDQLSGILGRSPGIVEQDISVRRRDLRERLDGGVLGEMVAKAAALDPLIAHSWREVGDAKFPPFHTGPVMDEVIATHALHEAAGFKRAKAIVVIPHCRISGATRVAAYLTEALAKILGEKEVVVIRTDMNFMQFPDWFPEGCRHVDFSSLAKKLPEQSRQKIFVEFLRALKPGIVFNVNSRLFWDSLLPYGTALAESIRLYTYFFCNDKNIFGLWNGYPLQKFYRHFDVLAGVATDSNDLANELRKMYSVPEEQMSKIVTLATPIGKTPACVSGPAPAVDRKKKVFWAGRFDRQKRVDIVYTLARKFPEADFHLWGEPVLDRHIKGLDKPNNITLEGIYNDFEDLPLDSCDLWLYTAEWDGVPNILIDVAAAGIPLVGSLVGGTGEILQEGLSEGVSDIENVEDYAAAIRRIFADPDSARERAVNLRERVLTARTLSAYRASVEKIVS